MNKKILSILIAAAIVLTMTGCNRAEPDDTSSTMINVNRDDLNYTGSETLETSSSSGGTLVSRPTVSGTTSDVSVTVVPTHPNTTGKRPTNGVVYNTTIKDDEKPTSIFGNFDLVTRDKGSKTTDENGITTESFSMFGRTFDPHSYGAYASSIAVFKGCSPANGKFSISIERNAKNKHAFEFIGLGHRIPLDTTGNEDKSLPAEFYLEVEKDGEILDYSASQLVHLGTGMFDAALKAIAVKLDIDKIDRFNTTTHNAVYDVDTDIYFYTTANGIEERIQLGMLYEELVDMLGKGEELIEELLNDDNELVKTNYYYAYKSCGYVLVVQKETVADKNNPDYVKIPDDATPEEITRINAENEKIAENGTPRDIITAIILIKEEPNDPTLD